MTDGEGMAAESPGPEPASLLKGQAEVLESIASGESLQESLVLLTRVVEAQHPGLFCSVLLLDSDGIHARHGAAPSLPPDFVKAIDGMPIGPKAGSCGTAMFTGKQVIVTDIHTDPLWREYLDVTLPTGLKASWSAPIRFKGGTVLGAFAMYYKEARGPREDEVAHIDVAVKLAGIAISRRRTEEALVQSEERFRNLVENSSEVFFMTDAHAVLTYVSPALEAVTGWLPHEVVGRSLVEFFPVPDATAVKESFARRLSGSLVSMEHRLLTRNGQVRWMRTSSRPLRRSGRTEGICAVMMDITSRKLAEEQLRQSQKMEAIGRLAGGIAHDFNNLLTAINGYSSLCLSLIAPELPVHGYIEEIMKSGERAAGLTRQLLAYSRKQILAPTILNLNEIFAGMEGMLSRVLGENIELAARLDPDLKPVKADRGQMEQVLLNLVLNARDAMTEGGKLTVATDNLPGGEGLPGPRPMEDAPGAVRLSVSDTGHGITPEVKAHLFEPFFTTKPMGKGTGLGLSVVYGIVKQSDGAIEVESVPGRGSTFSILLPEARGSEAEFAAPGASARHAGRATGTELLLLAEDEEGVRIFAGKALESLGYRVLSARNGLEALRQLEEHGEKIRMVITDLVMPEMGGDELAEQIGRQYPHMPILYMSGYQESAERELRAEGRQTILWKPFNLDTLANKVRRMLDTAANGSLRPA